MTTIIIEDEKPAARLLKRKLEKINVGVDTMLHSVEESIDWFSSNKHPDLIFLDIQLSDGLSFEIFEKIKIESAVIFTTAYDEYAIKAFRLNSVDYLLKPIDEDELEIAVSKFASSFAKRERTELDLNQIRKIFTEPSGIAFKQRFTVKAGTYLKVITLDEIECFFSENKGTYIHTNDNRNHLLETTLETLELELDPKLFFRVSRKFIVPMKTIRQISIYSNSRLKIILPTYNEDDVVVSREKVADFKSWLDK